MNSAIIVAAGQGLRMGGSISKQYLPLDGVPILRRTLSVFTRSGLFEEIILVVAEADRAYCRRMMRGLPAAEAAIRIVAGGRDRQTSVFNGLEGSCGQEEDAVLIHDGVRPFVSSAVLARCLAAAHAGGACIAAVRASDTLKEAGSDGGITRTLPRDTVWLAQTPQGFRLAVIRAAHRQARAEGFAATDDAQLVERMGHPVTIVPGSRINIKITTPEDMPLAEAIWRHYRRTAPEGRQD